MKIKIFECGLCKPEERKGFTRKGFRKHLAEEHKIVNEKFNNTNEKGPTKQKWVIEK